MLGKRKILVETWLGNVFVTIGETPPFVFTGRGGCPAFDEQGVIGMSS
jgi:hypothetical protein